MNLRGRRLQLAVLLAIGIAPFEFNGWYNLHLSIHGFWIAELAAWVVLPTVIVFTALKLRLITLDEMGFHDRIGNVRAAPALMLAMIVMPVVLYHVDRWSIDQAQQLFPTNYLHIARSYREFLPPPGPTTGWLRLLAACYFAASAGIVEEVYCRATFLKLFPRGWVAGVLYVAISSLVFASTHWETGIQVMFEAAVFGMVAAVFFRGTGNIWPLILSHAIVDFLWFS